MVGVDATRPVGAALKGHTGPVGGVAYSPDGTLLAASTLGFSRNRLWDAETGAAVGQELASGRTPSTFSTFLIEHDQGSRPAFAPDGRSLASQASTAPLRSGTSTRRTGSEAACELVGRDLTPRRVGPVPGFRRVPIDL